MATHEDVLEALAAMAEISGRTLSKPALSLLMRDLSEYPPGAVLAALARCRIDVRGFPSVADIVSRIADGRPGPEEAWAMIPHDEQSSVVWTEEMRDAFAVARPMIDAGDVIGARMAFKEVYVKLLLERRSTGKPARWEPSLGLDRLTHQPVLLDAVRKGRLTQAHAQSLLPGPPLQRGEHLQIVGPNDETLDPLEQIQTIKSLIERSDP